MGRFVAGSSSFCLYFIFFSPAVTRKLPPTSKREIRPNTDFVLAKTKEPRLGAWQASVAHAHRGLTVRDPRGVTRVSHIRVCRAARGELQVGRRGAPMDGRTVLIFLRKELERSFLEHQKSTKCGILLLVSFSLFVLLLNTGSSRVLKRQ